MEQADIAERVKQHFGDRIREHYEHRGQHALSILPADLVEVLTWLRDDPELAFDMLMDIGGVDYLGYPGRDEESHRFEVAYQMYSLAKNHRIRIKVQVQDDTVEIPTLWALWRVANWMEREVWDLFGVRFSGHKNLRRILCHDDFKGHALRKDYPINKRQKLSRPTELVIPEDQEWA